MLLSLQNLISFLRYKSGVCKQVVENEPLLVMKDGEFLQEALETTRVTEGDVIAKLREANALDLSKVRAVVLETTGDISVMHGEEFNARLLEGVEMAEKQVD